MRSISIVYKLRAGSLDETGLTPVKRSVDEYYRQLLEKEKCKEVAMQDKQAMINHIRIKTSRKRNQDEHQLYASLNVMHIPVQVHPLLSKRSRTPSSSQVRPLTRDQQQYSS